MNTHAERQAAAADERARIASAHEEAVAEARGIIQEAANQRDADAAALDAQIASDADQARAHVFAQGDARLLPIVRSMHDELTNRGAVALVEAIEALDQIARAGTGEVFPSRRIALLLAEVHRQARPAILAHLAAPRAWYSRGGGGLGGTEFGGELRHAIERHDIAGVRSCFESFDAKLWSLSQQPVDEQALVTWQTQIQPDPRVLRAHQAAAAEREAEAQAAVTKASCEADIRKGWCGLGWPDSSGVTYA